MLSANAQQSNWFRNCRFESDIGHAMPKKQKLGKAAQQMKLAKHILQYWEAVLPQLVSSLASKPHHSGSKHSIDISASVKALPGAQNLLSKKNSKSEKKKYVVTIPPKMVQISEAEFSRVPPIAETIQPDTFSSPLPASGCHAVPDSAILNSIRDELIGIKSILNPLEEA